MTPEQIERPADASHEDHYGWWEDGDMSSTHHVVYGTKGSIAALRALLADCPAVRALDGEEEP